jgi:ABC-type antimicrobial peptide transport system permease subunit
MAIKKVYALTSYDDVITHSDTFDEFAKNPANIITNSLTLFEDNNIARIIVNKYRLNNINITEDDLNPGDLDMLTEKIDYILRIKEIESSETSIEKVWFMAEADKIIRNN